MTHPETIGALLLAAIAMTLSACVYPEGQSGARDDRGDRGGAPYAALSENDPRLGAPVDTVCFPGGLVGFYEVGDQAIILRRTTNDSYLVRTGHCPQLDAVEGLRIPDPSGCLRRGDRIDVFDTQFPRRGAVSDRPDRCLVTGIYEWREGLTESSE